MDYFLETMKLIYDIGKLIINTFHAGLFDLGPSFPLILLVVLLLVSKQYNRQRLMERKIFGITLTRPFRQTLLSLGFGLIGGFLGSVILLFVGVDLTSVGIIFVWPVALLLMMYSPRYMCFSYAGGIVGIISLLGSAIVAIADLETTGIVSAFLNINLPGLMAVVGILHLVESILIYLSGAKGASPMFLKLGNKVVGGFTLQRFWPVPIVTLVAMVALTEQVSGGSSVAMPSWWPLIGSELAAPSGYTLFYYTFPIVAALGYGDIAVSTHPKLKSKKTALQLAIYSILLVILSVLAAFLPILTILPVLFAPLAHEYLIVASNNKEFSNKPLFVAPEQGIKVLSVLRDSIGEKMGIEPGYTITRVNGTYVENEEHFKELIVDLSTYAKFEVMDNDGRYRHVQAPLFGKRRQLGLIIIPKNPEQALTMRSESPLENLWRKLTKAS